MVKISYVEPETISLIQQTKEGRIVQIAITENQSKMLQNFMAILSKEHPLVIMNPEHDLVLVSSLKKKGKNNPHNSLVLPK
ncbi:MAG: hypothetical protein WAT41_04470 [Flavobacteriales bacterium]